MWRFSKLPECEVGCKDQDVVKGIRPDYGSGFYGLYYEQGCVPTKHEKPGSTTYWPISLGCLDDIFHICMKWIMIQATSHIQEPLG